MEREEFSVSKKLCGEIDLSGWCEARAALEQPRQAQ